MEMKDYILYKNSASSSQQHFFFLSFLKVWTDAMTGEILKIFLFDRYKNGIMVIYRKIINIALSQFLSFIVKSNYI